MRKGLTLLLVLVFCLSGIVMNNKQIKETNGLFMKSIVIDPGHGGKDNGASYENVLEDEINLKISKLLLDLCLENNIVVAITRTDDYDLAGLYAKNRKNEDLKARVKFINNVKPDAFISIHLNVYSRNDNVKGPMVYCRKNDDKSLLLGQCILNELNSFTLDDKPLHVGNFYLLNQTFYPGVFVECGFLSNDEERSKLVDEKYQILFVKHLFNGLIDYFTHL